MDADVLGCINIQRRTMFNALYPALEGYGGHTTPN
jgi:hypothetical protein